MVRLWRRHAFCRKHITQTLPHVDASSALVGVTVIITVLGVDAATLIRVSRTLVSVFKVVSDKFQ